MKLVTYNIQYGIGLDGRFDLARIAASLAGADVIALQEVTRGLGRNGGADLVAELSALLPDYFVVFGPAMDVDLGIRDAAGRPVNRRIEFGNMVLARWPIVTARNLLLPRSRRLARANLQRAALEAVVDRPGDPLRVYSVHLDHISSEERVAQVRAMKKRALAFPLEGGALTGAAEFGYDEPPAPDAFILFGDFNMDRGSPEHRLMVGEADPHEGRQLVYHHPVDAYDLASAPAADAASWVDPEGRQASRLIDYAFLHASLAPRLRRWWIDETAQGSDHRPLWIELG